MKVKKQYLIAVFGIVGFISLLLIAVLAKEYKPYLRLEILLTKTTYLPREPIVFRLQLESLEPHFRMAEVDWNVDALATVVGKFGNRIHRQENFWLKGEGYPGPEIGVLDSNTKPENFARKIIDFSAGKKVLSEPMNLLDGEGNAKMFFIENGWSAFRCDEMRLIIRLSVMWVERLHHPGHSVYTDAAVIKVVQPPTQAEQDALRLLDLYTYPPYLLSDEDKNLLLHYGIPVADDKIDIESEEKFLLIIRDNFPETIYGAEAGYYYASLLEGNEAKEAYEWVIENHPDSWWAHLAQKALEELQK